LAHPFFRPAVDDALCQGEFSDRLVVFIRPSGGIKFLAEHEARRRDFHGWQLTSER
jgi:hypothetical protein